MASMVKRPVPDRDSSEDELQEMFHKFHITDTTASLLQEEGYTSIKLLENLGTLGPDAVNEISGLRGAQKAAVKAMLKALVPDEGDTSLRPPPYSSFEEVNLSSQPPPCTCFAVFLICRHVVRIDDKLPPLAKKHSILTTMIYI